MAGLRACLRQREWLLDYAAAHIQHMQKALMQMNLQLHHVVIDITGVTGMAIIRAIVAAERGPTVPAAQREAVPRDRRDGLSGSDWQLRLLARVRRGGRMSRKRDRGRFRAQAASRRSFAA